MMNTITSQWFETSLNQYLKLDPEMQQQLLPLQGKVLCIDVLGLNKQYYIFPSNGNVAVDTTYEGEPDTIIKGSVSALMKLSMSPNTAPLMLSGEIEITGDVRTGRTFKKCLSNMSIDWEEQASSFIGDVPANFAFNALRQLGIWSKKTVSSVTEDLSEYVQEESRDAVTGVELNIFNKKVDRLRDDVSRLEAIINKLIK